jgi:hypothetical protein
MSSGSSATTGAFYDPFLYCLGTIAFSSGSVATVVTSGGSGLVKHVIQTPHHITIEEEEVRYNLGVHIMLGNPFSPLPPRSYIILSDYILNA